jgi:acyl transferase domain-containing protein/NAD(P)H-dependent flavin oxidoreductase YrpB (nitropropane dioxygenase family)
MHRPRFIVLTPPGTLDVGVAIAACRAGALGLLDWEYAADSAAAASALHHLRRYTSAEFGVKLGPACGALLSMLEGEPAGLPAWVLLCGGEPPQWEQRIAHFRGRRVRVLMEATNLSEALCGERWAVDGLVLKGHEAGGRIGCETSYILLQRCIGRVSLPVWVQGGIGLHTMAACRVAGAAGVVLDSQLLLSRESPLGAAARSRLATFDGSQTACVGERLGRVYRCYYAPGLSAVEGLRRVEDKIAASAGSTAEKLQAWQAAVSGRVGSGGDGGLWLLGQDAALAAPLAQRYQTVAGILHAMEHSAAEHLAAARRCQPLAAGSPLAVRHGTRYPIVQGPMTRVSDTPEFAEAVAQAGALPVLALALLRRPEAERLLQQTAALLADRPWGVGILGFAPPEIRRQQFEAICQYRPPVALIAGGRPDQAGTLEAEGIAAYLHVPSPELLRLFLREGARRFVLEGRECGGHVGPRSSFVLWDAACDVLLQHLETAGGGDQLHVLLAGGIHDGRSAAMAATTAGRLAERGAAVGVLMGTAYLFTQEAVETGAIVKRFQEEALRADTTVLLRSGPGHEIRCVDTPYAAFYRQQRELLRGEGKSPEQIRTALERMNVGRLRIAAKGIDRHSACAMHAESASGNGKPKNLIQVSEDQQHAHGLYMMGQVAPLRSEVTTLAELHEDVSAGATRRLQGHVVPATEDPPPVPAVDVAIIGIGCFFPQAGSLRSYWQNVLQCRDAVREVPLDHWDWRLYFEPDAKPSGKISSKWGGFLDDVPFDPLRYGMPPNSLTSIEPLQLLLLEAVRQALDDAGYARRPLPRERVAVILGAGGGAAQLSMAYAFAAYLPLLDTVPDMPARAAEILARCQPLLPKWTEDTFPGILLNVAAGRVANRFDFGGCCFAVDAACGSSLAALYLGTRELQAGASDVAVVMGGDTVQNPFTYMLFSSTNTFSPRGRCRPFDESADGIVISEGIGVVILKRLADAERDGDRIYAVIKGVGASSDGRDKGLTAPRPEGQVRALRRAYASAGVSPERLGLLEAHGTGTVAGDRAEVESAGQVLREAGAQPRCCALSSVKSMIGHTKCAAGLAGLINATLALHHKIRPPILIDRPNPKANFPQSPFFLNTQPRPWVHGGGQPRCAGLSAFGFGGTNFHAVLEEYSGDFRPGRQSGLPSWPAELFAWRRPSKEALIEDLVRCQKALAAPFPPALGDLAASLWETAGGDPAQPVLTLVASSHEDLRQKVDDVLAMLRCGAATAHDPRGIYFAEKPSWQDAKIAFLFPGQGAQHPDMLAQLAMAFPEVREAFDQAERILAGRLDRPLGSLIYPPSPFSPEEEEAAAAALMRSDVAQPAVGAACLGVLSLMTALGVEPNLLAGHSYGDLVALCAAGAISADDLILLSHRRGQLVLSAAADNRGGMVAVNATQETCAEILAGSDGVTIANLNAPDQVVISGTETGLEAAVSQLSARGIHSRRIDVGCPFHCSWMAAARQPLAAALAECHLTPPRKPVYSNTTAAPFPPEPAAIAELLVEHLTSPVQFQAEIEAMYAAGARIFLEIGPQGVLTGLVGRILDERPHLAVASNLRGRDDLVQLQHALGQLLAYGVPVRLDRLLSGRQLQPFPWSELARQSAAPTYSPTTWLVNSMRARPYQAAEPAVLGQPLADDHNDGKAIAAGATGSTGVTGSLSASAGRSADEKPADGEPQCFSARSDFNPVPALPAVPTADGDEAARVMFRFQDLMSQFLETQRSVMESYFQESGAAWPAATAPVADLPPRHAEQPPPAVDALQASATEASGDMPAPLPQQPEAAVVPAESQPKPAGSDRQALTEQLLALISKRTGYPREMLDLGLNLEADLGIDSIKRVEILSGLLSSHGNSAVAGQVEMEKLTSFKCLGDIINHLVAIAEKEAKTDAAAPAAPPRRTAPTGQNATAARRRATEAAIRRMLVRPVMIAPPPERPLRQVEGTLLITDDGRGVAAELLRRLRAADQQAVLVGMSGRDGEHRNGQSLAADLTDPAAVEDFFARIKRHSGEISGIIHLLPLAEPPADESFGGRICREVKSLFLLARALARRTAARSDAQKLLLAATAMGGSFGAGTGPLPDSFFPGQGGIAGLVKSLAHEWPEALVRVVDFDLRRPPAELAARLVEELGDEDGPVEVGYTGAARITLECFPAPVDAQATGPAPLDSQSTILVTGGARGITAAVGLELARRYRPRLVLIGRSPLPADAESAETAGLPEPAALKAAILEQFRRRQQAASPAEVEKSYRRLLREREIRANLAKFRATGAEVHYYQADVRDEDAFAAVVRRLEERFGGCDAAIHGAGVIDDKLIGDKTVESYDYVFGTKLQSALNLSRLLRPEKLKFCAFFASVAGRFGNRGQSDYAAANEVLSKLAAYLDQRWPGRVVSVVWGPWSQIGMVSELQQHLSQRGLELIPPEVGPLRFDEELRCGRKGQSEVVIAGDVGQLSRPHRAPAECVEVGIGD